MHVIPNGKISFFLWLSNIPLCVHVYIHLYHIFFIHSSINGHMGCLCILAIVNDAARNNRCGEKGTLMHCQWECKLVQPLWKTMWRLLKNLKVGAQSAKRPTLNLVSGHDLMVRGFEPCIRLCADDVKPAWDSLFLSPPLPSSLKNKQTLKKIILYVPAIALLGIYPRDTDKLFWRDTCTPMFIAALSTIAKVWKEPKCPSMDEWIKKIVVYIYDGVLLGNQKEWNLAICNYVDGIGGYDAKRN